MKKEFLRQIMTAKEIEGTIVKIATEIMEDHPNLEETALIGIRRRGVTLAERLRDKIREVSGQVLPLGILDITFYRDDLSLVDSQPVVEGSHLNFEVSDRDLLLVDDVLYTGRTTRAALESILDYGRPRRIKLIVLVDRGHRELPIQANYVGRNVETSADEMVEVRVPPIDDEEGVFLTTRELMQRTDRPPM